MIKHNSHYEKFLATGEVKCIDVEIPFRIPQSWQWVRLGCIGATETGTTPTKTHPEYFGIEIPFYSPGNIQDDKIISQTQGISTVGIEHCRIVTPNTILQVCIGGSIGKAAITQQKCAFNQQINSISVNESIDTQYIFLCLLTEWFRLQMVDKSSGTATPIINRSNWESLLLPIPPYNEQLKIVDLLESLKPHIENYSRAQLDLDKLNSEINTLLKKAILQEAIQGRLVPQGPNDEPASVLLERIRAEKARLVKEKKIKKEKSESVIFRGDDNCYFEKLSDGTIRSLETPFDIPDSWEWVRCESIFDIWSARRVHERDWRSSGVPFYRAREIGQLADKGHVANELYIDNSLYSEFSKSGVPQRGDLLVTAVGTLGKVYVVPDDNRFYFKDGSVICLSNFGKLNPTYLKYALMSDFFISQYANESQGTTVATLTMVRVKRYLLPIPPLAEQERIVQRINGLYKFL